MLPPVVKVYLSCMWHIVVLHMIQRSSMSPFITHIIIIDPVSWGNTDTMSLYIGQSLWPCVFVCSIVCTCVFIRMNSKHNNATVIVILLIPPVCWDRLPNSTLACDSSVFVHFCKFMFLCLKELPRKFRNSGVWLLNIMTITLIGTLNLKHHLHCCVWFSQQIISQKH